jgi:aminoglycoside/choline kinase family phosphotransferase
VLTRAVATRWPGARLTGIDPLKGDASSRRYARLHVADDGAPPSIVAMLLPRDTSANVSEEPVGSTEVPRELPFLNIHRYLSRHGVPVPAVLHEALADGVLLLEDIGDLSLAEAATDAVERGVASRRGAEAMFEDAVDTLARIASLAGDPDPACVAFQQVYDRGLIGVELDVFSAYGLAATEQRPRDPSADPELRRALDRLGDGLAAQPQVFMHRDYHAWNLHLDPRDAIRVIDFQDALLGPALYDLASLCTDRDSDRFVSIALERHLVSRFGSMLARHGGPSYSDPAALQRDYLLAVAYRTMRVIGRFGFLAIERHKSDYLRFLPRMAAQTKRALAALGDRELSQLLAARSPLFA